MPTRGRRTLTQINRAAGTLALVALNFVVLGLDHVRALIAMTQNVASGTNGTSCAQ